MNPGLDRRAVFIDIDGTLLTHDGRVPASASTAIRTARACGHLVFLATGRSLGEIPEDVRAIGFDGIIAATGGYIELTDGRVLLDQRLDPRAAVAALDLLGTLRVPHFVQTPDGLTGSPDAPATLRRLLADPDRDHDPAVGTAGHTSLDTFVDAIDTPTRADAASAADKIVFLAAGRHVARIRDELATTLTISPPSVPWFGADSGELTSPGVHKGWAVGLVLQDLGLPASQAVAFGDSANDVEMLSAVGTGIAMADGSPLARAAARRTTESAHQGGIAKAFTRLGLLDAGPGLTSRWHLG